MHQACCSLESHIIHYNSYSITSGNTTKAITDWKVLGPKIQKTIIVANGTAVVENGTVKVGDTQMKTFGPVTFYSECEDKSVPIQTFGKDGKVVCGIHNECTQQSELAECPSGVS